MAGILVDLDILRPAETIIARAAPSSSSSVGFKLGEEQKLECDGEEVVVKMTSKGVMGEWKEESFGCGREEEAELKEKSDANIVAAMVD